MSRGAFLTGPAAILAFVAFFLPWVTSSCRGQEVATLSGYQLATGTTVEVRPVAQVPISQTREIPPQRRVLAIPFAAVACVALVALVATHRLRSPLAGAIVVVLAVGCLLIMLNRTLEVRSQANQNGFDFRTRYGAFAVIAAYALVLMGGLIDILAGWRARATRRTATANIAGPEPPREGPAP